MRHFLFMIPVFFVFPLVAHADTIHVPGDQPTIQAGINAASNGDTVLVAPGIYVENIDFKGRAITLISKQGATSTIIDGNQSESVVVFKNSEKQDSVLEGFTLTNGLGTTLDIGDTTLFNCGGGIQCDKSSPTILNNIVTGNKAKGTHPAYTGLGGGIFCLKSNVIITNNTITYNSASGLDPAGGGVFSWTSSPTITNTILWNNNANTGPEIYIQSGGNPSISYCDIKGGWPGTGNIDKDPEFVNSKVGSDHHILYTSPCRNAGFNSAASLPSTDFEGNPRISEGTVDIGADEFHRHLYCMGDIKPVGLVEVKLIGIPWTKPVGLWLGLNLLDPPLKSKYGNWYLAFPYSGPIDLGIMPMNGVWILSGYLPSSPPGPYSIYMQALIGDTLTNLCTMNVQ